MITLAFLVFIGAGQAKPEAFLASINGALQSSQPAKVRSLFEYPDVDSKYLLAMAQRRSGLFKLHAAMIPTPPGWEGRGAYWAVIHTFQDIEEDHDPVFEVLVTGDGLRLGHEIREDDLAGWKIEKESYQALLSPAAHRVDVDVTVTLKKGGLSRAPIFRLNDVYALPSAAENLVVADESAVPKPSPGSIVRAGSLLIPWTATPAGEYTFKYGAVLERGEEDKVSSNAAYVTAWWLPSLGRLPYTVAGTIEAPNDWVVRGEGVEVGAATTSDGNRKTTTFRCDLPISYPKVIGGLYKLAAEQKVGDQSFKIFQLAPVDQARADVDLKAMVDAAAVFQSELGPLPFPGYECYDADTYYGIESYSHTLLNRRITHYISHEMGHSFFGGLAPCPYVHDSWNEGVTQYLDSVLLLKDADKSLETALTTLDVTTPLTEMPEAHGYGGASYWRGCYVMKMLESEIGADKVLAALKDLAQNRRGLDTRWRDLRPIFERAGGKPLDWFWAQWIEGSKFPTLRIYNVERVKRNDTYRTFVKVSQTGTPQPYRLKFALQFIVRGAVTEKVYDLSTASDDFTYDSQDKPDDVKLVVFPYTLARAMQHPKPQGQ